MLDCLAAVTRAYGGNRAANLESMLQVYCLNRR